MGFPSNLFFGARNRETSGNLSLTAGATADTMSAWVTALTLKNNASLLSLNSGGAANNVAVDVGIGATPSVVIPAVFFQNLIYSTTYPFPLSLPAGTIISVRSQSTTASEASSLLVEAFDSEAEDPILTQWGQFGLITSLNTGLTAISTANTWTLAGTPAFNVRKMIAPFRDTSATNPVTLQIGFGPSTSSVTLIGVAQMRGGSSANVSVKEFSCQVPSGQNLYVQSSTNSSVYAIYYGG